MTIYLIGMMGSGKTTIGKLLSEKLDVTFYDLDSMIETKTHKTVFDIFEQEGEKSFRELEKKTLKEIKDLEGVVSCGGGIVLDKKNRHILQSSGETIFLKSSIPELAKRLKSNKIRPLLEKKDIHQELDKILSDRQKLYEQTADLIITVDKKTPMEITELILDQLN